MKHKQKGTVSRLLSHCLRYRGVMLLSVLCAVLSVPLGLLGPIFIGRAIDAILGVGRVAFDVVAKNLVYLLVSILLSCLLQWLLQYCTRLVSAKVSQDMRQQAFRKISRAPIARIDRAAQGDLVSRLVNDAEAVSEGVLQALTQLIPGIVTIVATIALMFSLHAGIALLVVVLTPVSVLFAQFVASRTGHNFRRQSASQGELSGLVNETLSNQGLVRAFCAEQQAQQQFEQASAEYQTAYFKATFYSSIVNPGTRLINGLVYAAVGVCGVLLVLRGGITIGGVSVFLTYANQYTKPFNEVSAVLTQIQAAFAGAARLFVCMDWDEEQPDAQTAKPLAQCRGKVDANAVAFSYHKSRPLIRDFTMHVSPGMKIALVGPTGCGKTTIINLLMRFYEIDAGEIRVDDTEIRDLTRDSLRKTYGMVLQDSWLKGESVAKNIAYARPDAPREEIEQAARAAYAHGFISRLPQGYDTVLQNGGDSLSEGQKQLLCIARIMLARPDMLILDEATSNIDTRTEMRIQKALTALMQGHTSFIVAHRLSTIENADVILVMREGEIIEQGTHAELLAQKGFYETLYRSQFALT